MCSSLIHQLMNISVVPIPEHSPAVNMGVLIPLERHIDSISLFWIDLTVGLLGHMEVRF